MEIFGIILSIPVALIASTIYIIFIRWIVGKLPRLDTPLILGGGTILAIFAVEIIFLSTIGAVKSRAIIGSTFYGLHLAIFFLGVPALANVLVLQNRGRITIPLAVTLCTVFAFILVLMQYGVAEGLYGIDGNNIANGRETE